MIAWYNKKLIEKPLITKAITSFCTFALGDVICQYLEHHYKGTPYSLNRAIKQGSFGFFFSPYFHFQFSYFIPKYFPNTKISNVIKSIAWDQTFNAVVFTSCFFAYLDLTNGKGLSNTYEALKSKLWPTLCDNWKVWPFLMAINFSIVPIHWRVMYANIFGMFWAAYLSFVQNVKSNKTKNQLK